MQFIQVKRAVFIPLPISAQFVPACKVLSNAPSISRKTHMVVAFSIPKYACQLIVSVLRNSARSIYVHDTNVVGPQSLSCPLQYYLRLLVQTMWGRLAWKNLDVMSPSFRSSVWNLPSHFSTLLVNSEMLCFFWPFLIALQWLKWFEDIHPPPPSVF